MATTAPIASVAGLSSGIQWRDLVDQIIAADTARMVTPLKDQSAARAAQSAAWHDFGTLAGRLRDSVSALADGSAFKQMSVSVGTPTDGGANTVSVAAAGAASGTYSVEVRSLAASEKLSGLAVADASAALGVAGQVVLNGVGLTISATDSLSDVRDKINALNTGARATRVTAGLVSAGGVTRLVLTSDATGARGIELADARAADGAPSTLAALGLVDAGPAVANVGGDGRVASMRLADATAPVASALGVSFPAGPVNIVVNGKAVSFDPATTSLADLSSAINAASPGASTTETSVGGATTWTRLMVAGSVASDGTEASTRALEALGILVHAHGGSAAQQVTTTDVLTGAAGGTASGATLLADLGTGGTAAGIQAGDTFTVTGRGSNGDPVQSVITVTNGMTVNDLLAKVQDAYAPHGAVTAQLSGGRIVVTDATSGSSQLSFSITAGLQAGTLDFGGTTTTYGHVRQLVAGADAVAIVDGVRVAGESNTLTGALGGASLTLLRAAPDKTSTVTVSADTSKTVTSVQSIAAAYNTLAGFVKAETASGGRLAFNASIRAALDSVRAVIVGDVQGIGASPAYARAASVGLSIQKDGTLSVDASKLNAALAADPAAVATLFATGAKSTDQSFQFVTAGTSAPVGNFTVAVTQSAARSSTTGASLAAYAGTATHATMTVTDGVTGKSASITLMSGDTVDGIAGKLAARFGATGMHLTATNSGGKLALTAMDYGATPSFTVAYTDAGGENPASQLGIAAGLVKNGRDAAATIDGAPMTGNGQVLTSSGGLVLRYAGASAPASAQVAYALGLGGALQQLAGAIVTPGSGLADAQASSLDNAQASLDARATTASDRIDRQKTALLAQFSAMEAALGKIQSEGQWLTSQISSLAAIAPGNNNH